MAFRNQCFLASVILLLEVSCCFGEQDLIYCEPDNCYDILGVQPTATTQEIRKAYRHLSKTLHPDVNKAKGAAETFRIIALANEILSNKDERAEYDYYLKHPEEAFYNKMRFYRRRYAPKTDARLVVFGFIAFVSVVQYFVKKRQHKMAVNYFKTYDKKFRLRVKEMATERLEQANLNGELPNHISISQSPTAGHL
uniref:J domain-containing protein n=1 Tax=Aplanochytrium stocchinoi TaxID=215587 RepID=A0A6S8A1F6_9STRA|mmetsp:Transcript_29170/g.36123  ORF Transcript_29170/g.36123 Transcript_29170/m.36123 type:complete len:196 (+) Transcript_29170:451-1038(+)